MGNHGSSRADKCDSRRGSCGDHGSGRRVGRYSGRSRGKSARGNHVTMMGHECGPAGPSGRGYKHGPARRRVHSRRGGEFHEEAYVPDVNTGVLRKLHVAYRKGTHEIGYNTDGHKCVTAADVETAKQHGSSLLYGEVLPSSVVKMLDARHLDATTASVLFDLGSGTGKLAMQAFLMYPNLKEVVGVELCQSRFQLAENAAVQLATRFPDDYAIVDRVQGRCISIATTKGTQHLTLRQGDLLETPNLDMADIVVLQTDLPQQVHARLVQLLADHKLRTGVRVLSYLNLREVWASVGAAFPLEQHPVNKSPYDRFLTSWSYVHGHHFYVWRQAQLLAAPTAVQASHATGTDAQLARLLPHTVPATASAEDPRDDGGADAASGVAGETTAPDAGASEPPSGATPRHAGTVACAPQGSAVAAGRAEPRSSFTPRASFVSGFIPVAKPCLRNVDTDSDDVSPPETPLTAASGEESRRASEDSSRAGNASGDGSSQPAMECSEVNVTGAGGGRAGSASAPGGREWANREANVAVLSRLSPSVADCHSMSANGCHPSPTGQYVAGSYSRGRGSCDRVHVDGTTLPSSVRSHTSVIMSAASLRSTPPPMRNTVASGALERRRGHASRRAGHGHRADSGERTGTASADVRDPPPARRPGLMTRAWRSVKQRLSLA